MNYPSVKTLRGLGLDTAQANTLRGVMRRELVAVDVAEGLGVDCQYLNTHGQRVMAIADKLMGGCGVEYVGRFSDYPPVEHFAYVNMRDTYDTTLIRWPGGRYEVGCWGDAVERLERRGVRVD